MPRARSLWSVAAGYWSLATTYVWRGILPRGVPMLKPIIVGVVVSVVILAAWRCAGMVIASRTALGEWSAAKVAKDAAAGHAAQAHKREGKPEIEVDLGKYNIVVHHPASNVTLRVNFHLV